MAKTIPMTIALSDMFFDSFTRLPKNIRKKVQKFLINFRNQSTSNGIHYEKIFNVSEDYRSARVDDNYRAILSQPKGSNVFLLLWVDTHDEAYNWAKNHVCHINPTTGSMQVYETVKVATPIAEIDKGIQESLKGKESHLFESVLIKDLQRLGVPDECLNLVRNVRSRDELEKIRSYLPLDAFESLVWLSEGETLETVLNAYSGGNPTSDPEESLKNTGSQRTFKVIETDEEMKQIVDASLERWRVFLHPTQKRLVERVSTSPMIVRGAAGTGKTVVAMHRAVHLVRRDDWNTKSKLLFTTFSKNLAIDISAQLDSICSFDEKKRIEVINIDAWVAGFLRKNHVTETIVYPGNEQYKKCWDAALSLQELNTGLSDSFYSEEWKRIILPQNIKTEGEYLKASRKGRGTPISRKQRKSAWQVFDEMRSQLNRHKLLTIEDACFMAIDLLKVPSCKTRYQAVIVDETQDFGNEALQLLAILATPKEEDNLEPQIFLVGDGQQKIYDRQRSLSSCGLNVRGRRSERLKLTYRTTEEIRKAANAVLQNVLFDDMDEGQESLKGSLSNRHGLRPQVYVASSLEDEINWIDRRIQEVKESLNLTDGDICIVARTNDVLERYKILLQNKDYQTVKLSRKSFDDRQKKGLRFATMHRVKGLEYKAVFIVGAQEGIVPLEVKDSNDPKEIESQKLIERSLFYVSASRAKDALFVSCSNEPGEFMKLLIENK